LRKEKISINCMMLLREYGYTRRQIAKCLGCSYGYIFKLEKKIEQMELPEIVKQVMSLDLSVEDKFKIVCLHDAAANATSKADGDLYEDQCNSSLC